MAKFKSPPELLFSALGDRTRLAVVRQLCRGPESVSRLAAAHKLALPTFVRHLRVLEHSGWVRSKKTGRVRRFEIEPAALQQAGHWLSQQRAQWEQRLDQLDALLYKLKKEEETEP